MESEVTDNRTTVYIMAGATFCMSAVIGIYFLVYLLNYNPTGNITMSLPGADGRPASLQAGKAVVNLTGVFQTFSGVAENIPGSWVRFRGPDFDNIVKTDIALAESFDEAGPNVYWSVDLGEGHAAPVVLNGRVYIIDYDEENRSDAIRCFSLANGEEIWRRSYAIQVKRNHGMSRTVPAITEKYLVTFGPRCHVVCLDPKTGDFKWGIDLQKDYGTEEPLWYAGQCPLIDGDKVILAPGGKDVLMMAVDCETGDVVWKTPNPDNWNMSHSSIMPMTFAGKRMYVYCALGGAVGVSAEEEDIGTILWQAHWSATVVAPSPVIMDNGLIYFAAGYGIGSLMLQIHEENGAFSAEELFRHKPRDWMSTEQQTPIYHEGHLFSIMPKDGGALRDQFVCYKPDGGLVWSSGPSNRFGLGPYLLADGKFYVLRDDGVLTVLKFSKTEYIELARTTVIQDGHDAWGPLALVGDRLLLRDAKKMFCIDIGANN